MTTRYDDIIKQAASDHLPGTDWRLVKAQLMAESALNPGARSPAGAMGIAQFMPETWADITAKMGLADAHPNNTDVAIPACALYMRQLHDKWRAPRPPADRYCLALASYNAGIGNLLRAQKKAGGANDYKSIVAQLHHVTGQENAKETRQYVYRIFGFYIGYLLGGA